MGIYFLLCLVLLVIIIMFPAVRCAFAHPASVCFNGVLDCIDHIQKKVGNLCPTGALDIYCGYFGSGKTLSAVHTVTALYNRYNGLEVFDRRQKKFVTQRILVLSNVTLSIPYVPLTGLNQVISAGVHNTDYDDENGTLTVTIVLMDELSVQMNSRDFKSNFNAYFLNTLLCCRHYHISFYGTAQRFGHCDKLLRDVTRNVIQCHKFWRFQTLAYYDAWQLENAQNPELVRPLRRACWFVKNADYNAYDTLAVVGNLEKSYREGDFLPDNEIISNLAGNPNIDLVTSPSARLRRQRRKK